MRILIVDDSPDFRRHLRQLLLHVGLDVVAEAKDIAEAKALVRQLHPDFAIVDVLLPGISGLEGTPQLKALDRRLRVVLVSAYYNFRVSARQAGALAFIPKDELDVETIKNSVAIYAEAQSGAVEGEESGRQALTLRIGHARRVQP